MSQPPVHFDVKKVMLVSRYATPLAIFLVAAGIVVSQPLGAVRWLSVGLLLAGILLNMGFVHFMKGRAQLPPWVAQARRLANIGINTAIVFILGPYFAPIWLLLALTPIATAIYDTRRRTLTMALTISGLLIGLQAMRQFSTPIDWGQQAAYTAFILLVSLMVNELSALTKEPR